MSVSVNIAKTDKRQNSTKVITSYPLTLGCELKEPTSIINPTLILEYDVSILEYNYIYIVDFSRYYFIIDIVSLDNNLWEISTIEDVLATYKDEIGSTTMMILRSSRMKNGYIRDTFYPTTGEVTTGSSQLVQTTSYTLSENFTGGCYVIGTLADNPNTAVIGQTLYVMTPTQFRDIIRQLFDSSSDVSWGSLATGVINSLFNPTDYITSCYWFPMVIGTSITQEFRCGKWGSGVSCGVINSSNIVIDFQAGIPKHPQASRGEYMNAAPFSQYALDLGITQTIHLDSTMLIGENNINIRYIVDPSTGLAKCIGLTATKLQELFNLNVQYGVPVNISSTKNNLLNIIPDAVGGALSAVSGNPAGILSAITSAGMDVMDAVSGGTVSNSGGSGSVIGHMSSVRLLRARFFHVTDDDPDHEGYPLCNMIRPDAGGIAGGYMIAGEVALQINGALKSEVREIEAYLTSGFYYE